MKLNNNIPAINALRGIAALMVTMFHLTKGFFQEDSLIRNTFRYGWTGVEVFFVISGFVITWSMINANYKTRYFGTFLIKRIIRIEPPYLISIILVISLNFLSTLSPSFEGQTFNIDINNILLHLGYFVRLFDENWFNPVYWSLEIEFHFYLLMAVFLPIFMIKKPFLQLFSLSILLLGIFVSTEFTPLFKYIDIFLIGIVIALFKAQKLSKPIFTGVLIIITSTILLQHNGIISLVVFCTASIILFKENILNYNILNYFGKISFSLYLLHVPLGGRIINIAKRFDLSELGKVLALIIALLFSIGISHLYYHFIEKPFHNYAKKISYSK
ncbi:acyltransferase family protein [Saccharicrinis sp. 156]|uniref:acyltransferase family protein n=1 Tax=Saccharicrinis sp. 156 TaxID=3417574 RepID=UPI003D343B73